MPQNNGVCSPKVKEKIARLREALHDVVTDPEVQGNRECAAEVKSHIARNLGVLNTQHNFRRFRAAQNVGRHPRHSKID
jgi:hypothetical protein